MTASLTREPIPAPTPAEAMATTAVAPGVHRRLVGLYSATSFLGAALLFLVQPMVAKMVLPSYGGSPAVWNTAMLFFQVALLGGYAYSHLSTSRLGLVRQPWLHMVAVLVPLAVLPIAIPDGAAPGPDGDPVLALLKVLLLAVGLPFAVVATTGPLLQRWFSATDHPRGGDPYFLYAAGNTGSLLALVGYPLVVEPLLTVQAQSRLWSVGYATFAALVVGCAIQLHRHRGSTRVEAESELLVMSAGAQRRVTNKRRAQWVGMAFIPSSLMLGVTTYISTDIAAVPLLWVVPLSLYLLSFIVAFGRPRPRALTVSTRLLCGLGLALALVLGGIVKPPTAVAMTLHLAAFAVVAYVAHSRLALDRPAPSHLTGFYLLISVGGALGGLFNALVAPLIFDRLLEYPLALAAAMALALRAAPAGWLRRRYGRLGSVLEAMAPSAIALVALVVVASQGDRTAVLSLAVVVAIAVGWLAARRPTPFAIGIVALLALTALRPTSSLHTERTFFGVYRVHDTEGNRVLQHGSTVHGTQSLDPKRAGEPRSYYSRPGPVGQVFEAYGAGPLGDDVAIVGLGAGALAAYGRSGQAMTIYEIDPAVVAIARDPRYFSYLSSSQARLDVVIGDGRLRLAEAATDQYGLMVFDAFSSDAIPVHLMTEEAIASYRTKLGPGGVMVFHISNRHLDLEPVLAGIAERQGLTGLIRFDTKHDAATGQVPSTWVVMSEDENVLRPLKHDLRWRTLDTSDAVVWSDDFSNILSVLSWR